jgi:hypothetical protein
MSFSTAWSGVKRPLEGSGEGVPITGAVKGVKVVPGSIEVRTGQGMRRGWLWIVEDVRYATAFQPDQSVSLHVGSRITPHSTLTRADDFFITSYTRAHCQSHIFPID